MIRRLLACWLTLSLLLLPGCLSQEPVSPDAQTAGAIVDPSPEPDFSLPSEPSETPSPADPEPEESPPPAEADPPAAAEEQADVVYITETGSKYHRSGCQYLSKSKIETTRAAAVSGGYSPCARCNP